MGDRDDMPDTLVGRRERRLFDFEDVGDPVTVPCRDGRGAYRIQRQSLGRVDFAELAGTRESYGQVRQVGRVRIDAGSLRAVIAALQALADEVR